MPTTPLGIWTPDDSDDWDLTVDLAASALSTDAAISTATAAIPQNALRGLYSAIPAFGQEGRTYYATDTNILWFDTGSAWVGGPATLTPAAGITLTHQVYRIGNLVSFSLDASKATDMTVNETITTLPAAYRPTKNMTGGLFLTSTFGVVSTTFGSVLTTGEVKVNAIGVATVRNAFFNMSWVV